jgi:hypothetical protein
VTSIRIGPSSSRARRLAAAAAGAALLLAGLSTAAAVNDSGDGTAAVAVGGGEVLADEPAGHLVVSEVMTGGASASDEFIEIYNPGPVALPLEGLEVVYVTASGATITSRASWASGSPSVPPGAHVLVANGAGVFAAIADMTYANGLAATGGSVAIRVQGASSAIDAVGWGTAASSWMEGDAAAPAPAGHSLERLPGGQGGSGQDSDQNSVDFVESATPDPENAASPPIPVASSPPSVSPSSSPTSAGTATPSASDSPTPTGSASASPPSTPSATATPTPTPSAVPLTIAAARALPDGAQALVEGVSLSDSAFSDGGGYLADATGGIAVLLSGGSFPRGMTVRVSGTLDQRFSQRTLRADGDGITVIATAAEPEPQESTTGAIGESLECELVEVHGVIVSAPTTLTSGIAVDLDDGSGVTRVLVASATGIEVSGWQRGASIALQGVVGQRDSSGSGSAGYRVQPRDALDILSLVAPPTPSPSPRSSGSASPEPSGAPGLLSIAAARQAPFNARVRVRGIVTLPSGLAEEGSAAIQDSSGAILLRLGDEAGSVTLGQLVEVSGTRSTKAGMETIRTSERPRQLGSQAQPDARRRATGSLGEADEAQLVVVRGAVSAAPRRTSAQNVYFDVDDGSGPIRIFVSPRAGLSTDALVLGSWLEVTGVLGQETSGQQPERGYRIWPRVANDLRIVAAATPEAGGQGQPATGGSDLGITGTAAGGGAGTASNGPVAQQGVPRLALAIPTPPVSAGLPGADGKGSGSQAEEESQTPMAAGLLAMGGLLLAGGGASASRGLWGRLLAVLRRVTGPDAPDGEPDDSPTPDGGLPRLVPLTVLDGLPSGLPSGPSTSTGVQPAQPQGSPRGPRGGGGRILPPT